MSFRCTLSDEHVIERPVLLVPPADTHKYARGSAMAFSGPALRTGASRLTAQAALAVGAGLVTLVGEYEALKEHAAHVTAIMLREADADLTVVDDRVRAAAIGPGAGISSETRETVMHLLTKGLPLVLDADAITSFADNPAELFEQIHDQVVLTPHEGEFARLFPAIDLADRLTAARLAADVSGAVVLLKGPETVVAAPDGRLAINRHASPWLATAGSGDVLAGLICGVLAQGNTAFEAACIAAWLHGDIGVRGGPGLTADRMADLIPLVLAGCLGDGNAHDTRPRP
ncbi:NAD(P)H-hydrate dehydratase [Sphingorhabdus sp.]|uniref:NAD(P)H-hydrate dehydratase n=1 Tax=Sphingorhabdus sp. TaxID=1902408 RepID=UPI0032B75ACF